MEFLKCQTCDTHICRSGGPCPENIDAWKAAHAATHELLALPEPEYVVDTLHAFSKSTSSHSSSDTE